MEQKLSATSSTVSGFAIAASGQSLVNFSQDEWPFSATAAFESRPSATQD